MNDSGLRLITRYFPKVTQFQIHQYKQLSSLYREWNDKINVISRKDIDQLYERHVLHSLAVAKFISFKPGTRILDVGTGGGFPGIPLAVFFPEVKFHLVDSIGKKIKVVEEIAAALKLQNVAAEKIRAEELDDEYDFVMSRAVAPMKTIYDWTKQLISSRNQNEIHNGWILLKGGDLKNEMSELKRRTELIPISKFFSEEFFLEKSVVYFS